jgi:hypothetical protein
MFCKIINIIGNSSSGRKHISYDKLETHDGDFLSSSNPHLLDIVGKEGDDQETQTNVNVNNSNANKSMTSSNTMPSSLCAATNKSTAPTTKCSSPFHNPKAQPIPLSKNRFGSISLFNKSGSSGGGRSVDFNLKTKKFVFPNRVPSSQEDDEEKRKHSYEIPTATAAAASATKTNITENVKDAVWLENYDEEDNENDEDDDDDEEGSEYYGCNRKRDYNGASSCSSDYEDEEDEEDTKNGIRCRICGCEKKYEGLNNGGLVKFN